MPATASPAAATPMRSMADQAWNRAPRNRPTATPGPNPSTPEWRAADDRTAPAPQDRHTKTASPNARLVPASFPSTNAPHRENHAAPTNATDLFNSLLGAATAAVGRGKSVY